MTTASTMSSLMALMSILRMSRLSEVSTLVAAVGEGGGVCSTGSASTEETTCDLLMRLLGCDSGDSERRSERRSDGAGDPDEADGDVDGRTAALEAAAAAAAARAAWVTGMWMPKLGRDSDLRRVLYGITMRWRGRAQTDGRGGGG